MVYCGQTPESGAELAMVFECFLGKGGFALWEAVARIHIDFIQWQSFRSPPQAITNHHWTMVDVRNGKSLLL
jgi:hypothetical protein